MASRASRVYPPTNQVATAGHLQPIPLFRIGLRYYGVGSAPQVRRNARLEHPPCGRHAPQIPPVQELLPNCSPLGFRLFQRAEGGKELLLAPEGEDPEAEKWYLGCALSPFQTADNRSRLGVSSEPLYYPV